MEIGVLGLGLMGLAIAERLQSSGYRVSGWNRSSHKVDTARNAGLDAGSDLAIVAHEKTLVLVLSDGAAVQQTLAGMPTLASRLVIQMGTIAPRESREFAEMVSSAGGRYIEAPVLGSIPEARSGNLIIMAGGSQSDFNDALPVLSTLGKQPRLVGTTGQGAALKLAMNQLIAGLTTAFSASLGLVRAEGIDTGLFMSLLRESALYAPTFDKKLEKMLAHDYARPNFPLKHLCKDARLFEDACRIHDMDTGVINALCALFEAGVKAGHGDDDYSSLYEAVNPAPLIREQGS